MYKLDWGPDMSRKPKGSVSPPPVIEEEGPDEGAPAVTRRGSPKNEATFTAIGRKVVAARKKMDMSQSQLAKAADLPSSTVFSVENGQHNTSIGTLEKIADALKQDMRDLLPGTTLPPATDEGDALLQLVESALQTTLGEMNRTTAMVQHVLKMVGDRRNPGGAKGDTEH